MLSACSALRLTSASTHPPPSVPAWVPSGNTSIAAPAFCGVLPRVSTTAQYTHGRRRESNPVNSASSSRIGYSAIEDPTTTRLNPNAASLPPAFTGCL